MTSSDHLAAADLPPFLAALVTREVMPGAEKFFAWLVIDEVGLVGASLDEAKADRKARSADGVLVRVPIVADYRHGGAE